MVFNPMNMGGVFNMSALWFFELDRLIREKNNIAFNRDAEKYFRAIDTIYTHVFMKIPDNTRDKIESHLKMVYVKVMLPTRESKTQKEFNRLAGFELCKQLDRKLMLILDKKKLFFPNINITWGEKALEKAMGV